jgi:hypothetical protein
MAKGTDLQGANMQAHFDPSVNPRQLLEQGSRGETYDRFFQGSQSSVWIAAPPDRVQEYLGGKEFAGLERKDHFDFNRCFLSAESKPSAMEMEVLGISHQIDLLPGLRLAEEGYYSCYLIPRDNGFISRTTMIISPESGGTRLTLSYNTEAPDMSAPEAFQMQLLVAEIPETLEQLLVSIKAGAEESASR